MRFWKAQNVPISHRFRWRAWNAPELPNYRFREENPKYKCEKSVGWGKEMEEEEEEEKECGLWRGTCSKGDSILIVCGPWYRLTLQSSVASARKEAVDRCRHLFRRHAILNLMAWFSRDMCSRPSRPRDLDAYLQVRDVEHSVRDKTETRSSFRDVLETETTPLWSSD